MNQSVNRRALWLLLCVAVGMVIMAGCGKKGAPRPPRSVIDQMRIVLSVSGTEGRANLSWYCDPCDPAVRGYAVYQYRTDASSQVCEGCPIVFEKAGQVTATQPPRPLGFTVDTVRGSHYRFKIVALFKSGAQGVGSNVVEIDTTP